MGYECWGCALSIAPLAGVQVPAAPLGACWDCHVFGCEGHAEKDRASGKWLCLPSVANALAYSAGIDQQLELPPSLELRTTAEFRRRFPHAALTSRREASKQPAVRGSREDLPLSPEDARAIASEAGDADRDLLIEALLLGSALAPPVHREVRVLEDLGISSPLLAEGLTGLLGNRYRQ